MTRGSKLIPGRGQNIFETVYEFLSDFGVGIAGPAARPYIPIFAAAFLLILFDNWIGLVPPVGKIDLLRAPSSDVNITIGMALVSFLIFHVEGFRAPRRPAATSASSSRSTSSATGSARGSSPCSSG